MSCASLSGCRSKVQRRLATEESLDGSVAQVGSWLGCSQRSSRFDAGQRCWYVDAEATADLEEWLGLAGKHYNVSIVWEPPEEEAGRHHFTGWF